MAKRIIIGDNELVIPNITMGILPLFGIAILLWLFTGIYIVGPDEVGVIRTFGAYTNQTQPGLNWHYPYPIQTVKTPKVTEVKRIEIGFRTLAIESYEDKVSGNNYLEEVSDIHSIVNSAISNAVPDIEAETILKFLKEDDNG